MSTPALPLAARLRAGGASFSTIAATLNQKGVPSRRGGRWFPASVRQVLLQGARPSTSNS